MAPWKSIKDVESSFVEARKAVEAAIGDLSRRYKPAFPSGADLDGCFHVLRKEHLHANNWRDEVEILKELFDSKRFEVWRVPGRARRTLKKATHAGGVSAPPITSAALIERLNWIEQEIKDSFGVSRTRLRKKRTNRAARAIDGYLVLVRNGSEPDSGVFRFSYALMVGQIQ